MSEVFDRIVCAIAMRRSKSSIEIARAVLAAMREPSDAMVTALNGYAVCAGCVEEGWAAAIDAALAEEPAKAPPE